MPEQTTATFSHVEPVGAQWRSDGLLAYFLCEDLGIADATRSAVIAHLVKAKTAPEKGTGSHRDEADFQIFVMTPS